MQVMIKNTLSATSDCLAKDLCIGDEFIETNHAALSPEAFQLLW